MRHLALSKVFLLVEIAFSEMVSLSILFLLGRIALSELLSLSKLFRYFIFANPNGQNLQTGVAKLYSKFEGDPTVNKFEIVVLLKHVLGQSRNQTVPA